MAKPPPIIQDGILTYLRDGSPVQIAVDSSDWQDWLQTASTFTFRCEQGDFTAHKERAGNRRGNPYWRAYRTWHGKLDRAYLGRSEELTLARLQAVAVALASQGAGEGSFKVTGLKGGASPPSKAAHPRHTAEAPFPSEATRSKPRLASLPVPLTSFIGRDQEVQAICGLLSQPEVRLLTITGTGGVGKTRLALEVASALGADFTDGVCFVPLAPVSDPTRVMAAMAQALGLWETADLPPDEQLPAALRERHLLLVLDNFEHLLEATPHLVPLFASCPRLCILVTSRAALHLSWEHEYLVPPLALPDLTRLPEPEVLTRQAAVQLFVLRTQAIQPTFHLTPANARAIAEICFRLDGLPLAIELAAARSKLLPPQALLKRLSHRLEILTGGAQDLPARQQTLRNTLQWSYDLLTQEEQHLFRWLCVFVGGCTLEAAEAVCQGASEPGMNVLEGVISLLDKSLVQQSAQEGEEPRLLLLETIREYGRECLQAAGELAAAEQAHTAYYLNLAEEAEPQLQGTEQVAWLERLEPEHQNLRAAIECALSSGEPDLALRISSALWVFWARLGYPREGGALLEQVLAGSSAAATPLRAKALAAAAALAYYQQDIRRFGQLIEAYLPVAQELGDQQGMALARLGQGWIALQRHPDTEVWAQLEESLADLKKYGDPWWIRTWLLILGRLAFMQADAQRALALMEESLAHARAAGDASVQAWVLLFLGQLALTQGELATAQARLEESLALTQGTHESSITPHVLTLQSWIRWRQGKTDEARASFNEVIRLMREQGNLWAVARVLLLLGNMAVGHGDVAEARADYAESLVLARHLQVEGFIASSLKGMGVVMAAEGQLVMAAWLWGAAELLQESQDVSLPAAVYEQAVQAARSQLGKQAFDAAWAQGRTLTLEQALAAQGAATRPTAAPAGPSSVPPVPKTPTYPAGLTAREVEILLLVAQGLSDAQVAEQLVISRRTVNWHLTSIYSKLGVSSRAAATRYAIEHQLC